MLGGLAVLSVLAAALFFRAPIIRAVGGASSRPPEDLAEGLSEDARDLLAHAWEGIDPARLVDYHVHLVGRGGDSGAYMNPNLFSWWHATQRLKVEVYASAAGIEDVEAGDARYVHRIASLARNIPDHGRFVLLAFDYHHTAAGDRDLENSEFYTPNDYALRVAGEHPDVFVAAASVHPYRADALEELDRCATRGVRLIKWLPNAMGIDPSDPRCDAYYDRLEQRGMALLSHAGEEKAVQAEEFQRFGNPLLMRRALDRGVKVVLAHCASLGRNADLDHPSRPRVDNFELFLRMMDDPRHEGLLFGEISAMTLFTRMNRPIRTLLERPDLWPRLVNGSDYPLPAINLLIQTRAMVRDGFLTPAEREALNEIYDFNPLLFDFVVKRTMRHPRNGNRFPASVFMEHPQLPVSSQR